ncbi:MAG TPA: LacI family DNA-binding transcriptional regulator [Alphaproteobacteria bacterium]|nr:LacI family DNA-binding transcriptional regulator [Alphaproteobacteria bacterium]
MNFERSPRQRARPASGPADGGETVRRARAADIARAAGVSTATVDRVLNRRPGVRPATAQRVVKAAAALGYLPEADLLATLRPKPMRLVFLLPAGTNRYLRRLGQYIAQANEPLAPFNVDCRCQFVEAFNPEVLADALLRHGGKADGMAFMALEHPLVREAVGALAERGVPVLTMISDLLHSRRAAYVGLDNRAAGRSAGFLLGRFLPQRSGKIALIAGSRSYRAHEEREMGFLHIREEMFPSIAVVGLREGHDDSEQNYRQTRSLLRQHADLVGIYNIGGASDGVGRALKESKRDRDIVFVGHGLTPDTRAMLIDGTMDAVITQDPEAIVLNCVRIFTNVRDGREPMTGVAPTQISLFVRENLP